MSAQSPSSPPYDVAIVGAGAAGLMAAIRAAERGRRAVVLEKNRRPGVKILMSGGTRCNITNVAGGSKEIVEAFGENGRFLWPGLKAMDPHAAVAFFEESGVPTYVEDEVVAGKVFPTTNRATDVLDGLMRRFEAAGAEMRTERPVRAVRALGDASTAGFEIDAGATDGPFETVRAAQVIVATGGLSFPKCGTTGDGYSIARAFGHTIVPTHPALVPIVVGDAWVHDLRGIALRSTLSARIGGKLVGERTGSLLFTHFGLSGPVALDLSTKLVRAPGYPSGVEVEMDLLPGVSAETIETDLREAAARGQGARLVKAALAPRLFDRLAEMLVTAVAKVPADRRLATLSKDERRRIVQAAKAARVAVGGDRGYGMAEVTSGGVSLDEVDPRTLESRRQKGLRFVGEVLDLDGPIGGFNFQAAWSTGWLAGSCV